MDEPQFFRPFGPTIMLGTVPDKFINLLNDYMDEVIANDKLAEERNHSPYLIGKISKEITVVGDIWQKEVGDYTLGEWALDHIRHYIQTITEGQGHVESESFRITSGWINDMIEGNYQPMHDHVPHDIAAVMYLRVPENYMRTQEILEDHTVTPVILRKEEGKGGSSHPRYSGAGEIIFSDGRSQKFTSQGFTRKPVVGDCYFFPGWLLHTVYPIAGEDLRRSMSFNANFEFTEQAGFDALFPGQWAATRR